MMDAYSIAVRVVLKNDAGSGLTQLAVMFNQTNTKATDFEKTLVRIHGQMKLAHMASSAGKTMLSGLVSGMKEATNAAVEWERQLAKLTTYGMTAAQNQSMVDFAKQMKVPGANYVQNIKALNEAQGVFRESGLQGEEALRAAKMAAPMLVKVEQASAGLDDDGKARNKAAALDMLRFIEDSGGLQSQERFSQLAGGGFKAIMSSGGNVNWAQLRQFKSNAGIAGMFINDESMFASLEPVIGLMKGGAAGTGLATAYGRANGSVRGLTKQAIQEFISLGLWDKSKVHLNQQGGIDHFDGNPFTANKQFLNSPDQWYLHDLLPRYQKLGLSLEERARMNNILFQRTGGRLFTEIDRLAQTSERSRQAFQKQMDPDQAMAVVAASPYGKFAQVHAAKDNAEIGFGEATMPATLKGAEWLTKLFEKVGAFADKHPDAAMGVIAGLGTLALALQAGGIAANVALLIKLMRVAAVAAPVAEAAGIAGAAGSGLAAAGLAGSAARAGMLGRLGLYGAAAWGVYEIGSLGSALKDLWDIKHREGVKLTADAEKRLTQVNLNIDGKKMAAVVIDEMGRTVSRPDSGASGFDPHVSLPKPAGGAY